MAEESKSTNSDLNAATRAADKRLREAHQDEWNGYKSEEAKARGIEWTPRLSPEQKRREQFKALLAEDPSLATLVQGEQSDDTLVDLDA